MSWNSTGPLPGQTRFCEWQPWALGLLADVSGGLGYSGLVALEDRLVALEKTPGPGGQAVGHRGLYASKHLPSVFLCQSLSDCRGLWVSPVATTPLPSLPQPLSPPPLTLSAALGFMRQSSEYQLLCRPYPGLRLTVRAGAKGLFGGKRHKPVKGPLDLISNSTVVFWEKSPCVPGARAQVPRTG